MPDIYNRPIAFTERESCHPDTGEHGILRHEWRLVPFNSTNPLHRTIALHRQSAGRFTPTVILETRYIRRGVIEPWQAFDGYENDNAALSDIDPKAIAIDCPALVWVQHDYKRQYREHEEQRAREREEKYRQDEERRLRVLSRVAWDKLYASPQYRPLCDEWTALHTDAMQALKDDLQRDREFMRLYRLATIESITMMSKRAAIRACIDYYNFMWRHRERPEKGSQS